MESILNSEKYISYNEYKSYCEENKMVFYEEDLDKNNEKFIEKKLIEYKDYFDNMFLEVGENIIIDDEQREIVLRDDEYCLVNAGAGTGKSTTMAAKVKYLVDKLHVKPEEIIMLSFTKKSSEDLDEKVNDLLDLGVSVSTFHSLGMKFIKKIYPFPVEVVGSNEQTNIICEYIKHLYKDKEKLKELIFLFKQFENKYFIAKGFIENFDKFDNFEDYFKDYKERKYMLESRREGGIHQYLINRLNNRNLLYTIKGEKVKSFGELQIANFLYINGIDYTYEKIFDEKVNEDTTYKPDFTVEYQGRNIYIEYFGLSNCYDDKNELNKKEFQKYNRIRRIKEKYQDSHKEYDFINLDYKTINGNYIDKLINQLLRRKVSFTKRNEKEVFNRILDNNLNAEFFNFTSLIMNYIDIFKNMLVDDEDYMFNKIKSKILNEPLKYYCYTSKENEERKYKAQAIDILRDIYRYYQNYLLEHRMIDYSDMINNSYKYIIKEVKNNCTDLNYKYIIVDEYQDITFQRFLFVKRLVEYYNAKLIAIGDDWQSIYSFNGSRLELFQRFDEMFSTYSKEAYLSTTYRYGQELVDISSKFILKNDEQSKKVIKSVKNLKDPVEFCEYDFLNEEEEINKIVHKLYEENPNSKILILARTNRCLRRLEKSKNFTKGIGDVLINKEFPRAKIEAITMHRSKGLTADQVIVFGLRRKVFPTKGKISHWIFEYFKLDCISEKFPYAEERRLFYVALTRTKNKVYLMVPKNYSAKSEFEKEILKIVGE